MLVKDLRQCVRHLRDLVEISNDLDRPKVFVAKIKSGQEFFSVLVDRAGMWYAGFNSHGKQFVQVSDLTSKVEFRRDQSFGVWDVLSENLWDTVSLFIRVQIIRNGDRTHFLIRFNGVHVNVAFFWLCAPALESSGTSLQLSWTYMLALTISLGVREWPAGLKNSYRLAVSSYEWSVYLMMYNDEVESVVTRQLVSLSQLVDLAACIKKMGNPRLCLQLFHAWEQLKELDAFETWLLCCIVFMIGRKDAVVKK